MTGYELEYISSTSGTFYSELSSNVTLDSVVEEKFLSTSWSDIIMFGTGNAYLIYLSSIGRINWYNGGMNSAATKTYWTLNQPHTVTMSTSDYKWNGVWLSNATRSKCYIPSSPLFQPKVKGNLYYFKITTNGVDNVKLVAWQDGNGNLGMYDKVNDVFYLPATGTWTAGPRVQTPVFSSLFMGDFNVETLYCGTTNVDTMYMGTDKVYEVGSKPAISGLTTTGNLTFTPDKLIANIRINSSENWTLTDNITPGGYYTLDYNIYNCNGFVPSYDGSLDGGPVNEYGLWFEYRPGTSIQTFDEYLEELRQAGITYTGTPCPNGEYHIYLEPHATGGPKWISYSQTSGTTGETIVTLTATKTSSNRNATITISTANYSATTNVVQYSQVSDNNN